jgi:hypothetical protein
LRDRLESELFLEFSAAEAQWKNTQQANLEIQGSNLAAAYHQNKIADKK